MSTTLKKTPQSKTKAEIRQLKSEWEQNPNWEIENTPGFEEFYYELRRYRKAKQSEWADARIEKELQAADSMGLELAHYRAWRECKSLGQLHRDQAKKTLLNLVYGTENVDTEQSTTVELFIDSLFRGTVNIAKAELIVDRYKFE